MKVQLGIFENVRADAWLDICIEKLKKYCPTPPFSETEMYKILAGEIYAEIPKMEQVVKGILKAGTVEDGLRLIQAVFRHPEFPAPDTISRNLRRANEILRKEGKLTWLDKKDEQPGLDQILVEIETNNSLDIDSSLEARFHLALSSHFRNDATFLKQGQVDDLIVDFLCRAYGLSVEIDGYEYHQDRQSFTWDRRKSRVMQSKGFIHFQFSGAELTVKGGIQRALEEIDRVIRKKQDKYNGHSND